MIDPTLKPLTLNVQKAFEIISKFNMVPTSKKAQHVHEQQYPVKYGGPGMATTMPQQVVQASGTMGSGGSQKQYAPQ